MQDYDRGLIVGENSFGKGLVQKEFPLQDGSAVRITTAKYYTPSGRCIQRDYKGKDLDEYYADVPDSTWSSPDSLDHRPLFHTEAGRPVYGGGGIMPDRYVPNTRLSLSPELVNRMVQKQVFFEVSNEFATHHGELSDDMRGFRDTFAVDGALFNRFRDVCAEKEIDVDGEAFARDGDYLRLRLKAEIARRFWNSDGYYLVMLSADGQFQTAMGSFSEARKLAAVQ